MAAKLVRIGALLLAVATAISALLFYVSSTSQRVDREAVRQVYRHGRLTKEEAREILGDTGDTWDEPTGER